MLKNVGTSERIARTVLALGLGAGLFLSASLVPVWVLAAGGAGVVVLLFTAASGSCLMNRMLGRNTCSVAP